MGQPRRYNSKYQATTRQGHSIRVHTLIAIKVLGRPLRDGECVHHIDGDGWNNAHSNLVLCESLAYHNLLEYRTRAFRACGNAHAVQCRYCKVWTDREGMVKYSDVGWHHRQCHNDYNRKRGWK